MSAGASMLGPARLRAAIGIRSLERWWPVGLAASIAALALGLRAYGLHENPPEFFEDELAGVVGAWSIVTTGRDVERTWLPFIVTRLEFKQPVYFFATVPFQALLGADPAALRLPAAVFGAGSTLLVAWLARRAFGWPRLDAFLAAAIFAVLPWAVHYSRAAMEPAAFVPFSVAGLGLLWVGLTERRARWVFGAAACLAVGAYTYHPALLMNAALSAVVVLIHASRLRRGDLVALAGAAALAAVLLVPYVVAFLTEPVFTHRLRAVSGFAEGVTPDTIGKAWRRLGEQWNPQWLFFASHFNFRNQPGVALAYPWLIPFLVLGVVRAIRRLTPADTFLLLWALLGAVPAALMIDSPHFGRALLVLPPLCLLAARGLTWAWWSLASRPRTVGVGIALLWCVGVLAALQAYDSYRYYFGTYPLVARVWWYYGTSNALGLVRDLVPAGSRVCIEKPLPVPHYTFPHYVAYYLADRPRTLVEGLSDAACRELGTFLLHRASTPLAPRARPVDQATDERGRPMYVLSLIDRRGPE